MTAHRLPRLMLLAMAVAVAAALVAMALRASSAISFERPLLVITSGAEEEALQGILRAMEGSPYVDPSRIPFSAAYYNWAFFSLNAAVIKTARQIFELAPQWTPTIGRLLALLSAALCWLAALACLRRAGPEDSPGIRLHDHLSALWLGFGPLVGWWALSLNVELWATLFSILAIWPLLAFYHTRPVAAVAVASLLSVAAWSFKQSYIFVPATLGLFLLLRRDWRGLGLTMVLHLTGVVLPFAVASPNYSESMMAWRSAGVTWFQFRLVMTNVPTKILPLLLGPVALWPLLARRKGLLADTPLLLGLCGLIGCLPLIPAAAKIGAAENYFFPAAFFLALIAARGIRRMSVEGLPPPHAAVLTGGWMIQAAACLALAAGLTGVTDVRPIDTRLQAQRPCVADLPAPLYAEDNYLSLPWMHAAGPHFILAYNYRIDRRNGRPFERGGIGGLVSEGYFASLALPAGHKPELEDQPLDRYRLARAGCAGLDIYLRRTEPGS